MANERAVVVRDQQGEIRAFHNMCRHRAPRVVAEDKGHCGHLFICPFHGWSYNLDGSLKNIPKSHAFPEIVRSDFGLKSLDCEIWHGMRSSAFDAVMLSDLELGPASFQNKLRELLPVVAQLQPPEKGGLKALNDRLRAKGKVAAVG